MRGKSVMLVVGVLLLAGLLVFAGCGDDDGTTEDVTTPDVTEPEPHDDVDAAQLFAQNCAACHGAEGVGGSAPALGRLGDDDEERIEQMIRRGGGGMPAFEGQLTDEQIEALTEYVADLE